MRVNKAVNDNLYAQAKAIFAQRFIGIETIPDGWKKGNLLDIANYLNGLAMQKFRPRDDEVGLPVLKIKELRQGSCSPALPSGIFLTHTDSTVLQSCAMR